MAGSDKQRVAFFGATGGCALKTLTLCLEAGYSCTACERLPSVMQYSEANIISVARTPSKLTSLLMANGISNSIVSSCLTITQGDVRDPASVKQTLLGADGLVPDLIISGIGMVISGWSFKTVDSTICTTATSTILGVLQNLKPAKKPLLVIISTTGISKGPRDVPVLFVPLYHGLLAVPHKDKRLMKDAIASAEAHGEAIRGAIIIRPTLLANGPAKGKGKVRIGTEDRPAVGYTISREDVGLWLFEEVVSGERDRWVGQKVSLTY